MKKKASNKIQSLALAAAMLLTMLPGMFTAPPMTAQAVDIAAPSGTHPAINLAAGSVYYGGALYRIVVNDGTTMTLFCDGDIGNRSYDSNNQNKDWSSSEICLSLNDDTTGFLSTLTPAERATIPSYGTTEIRNSEYPGTSPADDIVISQKIVLPSYDEVKNSGTWGMIQSDRAYSGAWWLRSPGGVGSHAAVVTSGGSVDASDGSGSGYVGSTYAIRPAFKLDLSSVIFTSAAAGGKAVTAGDTLTPATAPTGAVKLTVEDTNLSFSSTPTATGVNDRTITLSYTAVANGVSDYDSLSAIVKDSSGTVKYYGNLDDSPEASGTQGTASVTVPDDFATGDTLQIFVEEINVDNYTDYACAPVALNFNEQSAPTGLSGVGCTTSTNDNGKITGTTTAMEYSADNGVSWTACAAAATANLAPGSYLVRYAGKVDSGTTYLASDSVTVAVASFTNTTPTPTPDSTSYIFSQMPASGNDYTAVCSGSYRKFTGASVDGARLSSSQYSAWEGSTYVKLHADYISTLSVGTHTLTLQFTDGSASGSFTVSGSSNSLGTYALPYGEKQTPYTPSVTPSVIVIADELEEGTEEQPVAEEVGKSSLLADDTSEENMSGGKETTNDEPSVIVPATGDKTASAIPLLALGVIIAVSSLVFAKRRSAK